MLCESRINLPMMIPDLTWPQLRNSSLQVVSVELRNLSFFLTVFFFFFWWSSFFSEETTCNKATFNNPTCLEVGANALIENPASVRHSLLLVNLWSHVYFFTYYSCDMTRWSNFTGHDEIKNGSTAATFPWCLDVKPYEIFVIFYLVPLGKIKPSTVSANLQSANIWLVILVISSVHASLIKTVIFMTSTACKWFYPQYSWI